jgi:uncharacterized repeat protein (TIGR03803 family)
MKNNYSTPALVFAHSLPTLLLLAILAVGPVAAAQGVHYNLIYKFTGASTSGLISDSAGNFYGEDESGKTGSSCSGGCGTVFELSPAASGGWKRTVLYEFTGGNDGRNPSGGLVFDTSGNLYGTAQDGGVYGSGVVFELSPSSGGGWTESTLYSFTGGSDGGFPTAGVTLDNAGNIFGITEGGGLASGVVFELSPASGGWNESVLHSFTYGSDGAYPQGGVTFDAAGNLYGTAQKGGKEPCVVTTDGCGVVFELVKNSSGTWDFSVIFAFGGSNGAGPWGQLIVDQSGNLYGTTTVGGKLGGCYNVGCGVVFELSHSGGGWSETLLHVFQPGSSVDSFGLAGGDPSAGLTFDSKGNLYGTAGYGGSLTYGVVFRLSPASPQWKETVVWNFTGTTGGQTPLFGVALNAAGDVFGTTYYGGNDSACRGSGCGVLFEIKP